MDHGIIPFVVSATLVGAVVYAVVHLVAIAGVLRNPAKTSGAGLTFSVIVAARNEADRIGMLLESLTRQTRMPDEIIVVDDRSADGTADVVSTFEQRLPCLRCVRVDDLPAGMAPKKHALERGIAASSGLILCFTDADGILPPAWLETIESYLLPDVGIVVGSYAPAPAEVVPSLAGGLLERFISYEKFKTTALSAGTAGLGFAWMASGSNLAYRRSVYDQVGGFSGQHASMGGDDDLFVQRVRRTTEWKIIPMLEPAATVITNVPRAWREFYRQRARHFSAGRWYDAWSKSFLAAYHVANLLSTGSLFFALVWPGVGFLTAYVIKVCADMSLLALADLRIQRSRAWTWFLPLELLNMLYLFTAGPIGWLTRVRWKEGRSAA